MMMTKKSHNKKRNVGIIYEQLVLKLSKALVENDKKTFRETKNIITKYFKKGTELHKEHRLLNSLCQFQITESAVLPSIFEETKKATWRINKRKLDFEKSKLIRTINETFGKSFYSTRVSNYRDLATIDMLLREYKKGSDSDPKNILEYSDKVSKILLRSKDKVSLNEMKNPEVNALVVNLMREKFHKAYAKNLNADQMELVNNWIINGSTPALVSEVKATRKLCIDSISSYMKNCNNDFISQNLEQVFENVSTFEVGETLNESDIIKTMTMQEIILELSGEENE